MEVGGTNIFNRKDIDWERWVEALLWHQIVYHKNEYSGYDLIINTSPDRGFYERGDIVGDTRFWSYSIGETRQLTWKELALALGFFKDHLTWDGHDCKVCEKRKGCKAYFKDDPDQERCNCWWDDHGYPDDEAEYKKFMDKLMEPIRPRTVFTSLSKEEMDKFMKTIKEAE